MKQDLRLLLVEDSQDDADLILLQLRREGIKPLWVRVETREEIENELSRKNWDIIISDFNLPTFTAREALALAKAHGLDVPFLVVSGAIGEELAADLMRAGAHDVIMKGHLSRLAPAIERELREAEIRRENRRAEAERVRILEELQQAVMVRDEFLSIASHELRTPLTPLKMQLQMLERASKKATEGTISAAWVAEKAESADRQVSRMARLVDNLLDVSRIANQRLLLDIEDLDLSLVVADLMERFAEQASAVGCRLHLDIQQGVTGRWDRLRMEQIMTNLVSNALKYGARHPIEVTLHGDETTARISVRDHGIGISKNNQSRIFGRFERAVSGSDFGGLGLGLYIVKQLVEAHGGRIWVESEPGMGSTFFVELPRRNPALKTSDQKGVA